MPCQCKTERQRSKCMWWIDKAQGILETQPATGEVRFLTGCFPEVFFKLMEFVIKTNVSSAAAVESHRNIMDEGFKKLVPLMCGLTGSIEGQACLADRESAYEPFDNGPSDHTAP